MYEHLQSRQGARTPCDDIDRIVIPQLISDYEMRPKLSIIENRELGAHEAYNKHCPIASSSINVTCQCRWVQRDISGAYPVQPDTSQTLGVVRSST